MDHLRSWNDTAAKRAILDFVARVTDDRGSEYVPPASRIATFDNDGTLWCEQPLQVQFFFGHSLLEQLAEMDPSLRTRQPYKAYFDRDMKAMVALGRKTFLEVAAFAHAGKTEDEFDAYAREWLSNSTHPKLGKRFTDLTYRPQVELLELLRANGFTTFIVSGGGLDLMRAFAEESYGIPPWQVVGSSVKTRFDGGGERGELIKLPELNSFDDREVKVENIGLHIGRRPILAFGNSDGDLAMLQYCKSGPGPRLALLLHHDDAGREFAYDRDFKLSPLVDALDNAEKYGLTVVSMKNDWDCVFEEQARNSQRTDEEAAQ
jgi:phosphoglycolate phosphatase-like HAD superfamily hydrolase